MLSQKPKSDPNASSGLIPRSQVKIGKETARVGQPEVVCDAKDEPQIRLIREGDTVKAIEVVCTCGKHTILNCVY